MSKRVVLALTLLLLSASSASACLWDYDTLLMERRRFPTVVEMISGKFLRHSPEFYQWRVADRTAKLKADPSRLDWYDDLAVAHHKLGDNKKAIEIILQKDKLKPGLYETEANLGTFLLFDGQWEEALKHVRKALEINPNAHFGREKYQAYLIEYVLPRLKDGKPQLPLSDVKLSQLPDSQLFHPKDRLWHFLITRHREVLPEEEYDRDEAVNAVLGMMHFADYRSPILLEALGDLLHAGQYVVDKEQRLSARAYLKASYEVTDSSIRAAFRERADDEVHSQSGETLEGIEIDLKIEIAEADKWFAEVRAAEIEWIRTGKDPEAEFAKRFPEEPTVPMPTERAAPISPERRLVRVFKQVAIASGALLLIAAIAVWKWTSARRRRQRIAAATWPSIESRLTPK